MSIEQVITEWDGNLSCTRMDAETGAFFAIAVHSRLDGSAAGGTRAMTYSTLDAAVTDATRLSSAMTLKMAAAADLPMGGGKAVIALPKPRVQIDERVWRRILEIHADNLTALDATYWTGPDVGTTSADMDVLHELSGRAFGRSTEMGGPGSSALETAHGVHVAIRAAAREAGIDDLWDQRVLVQGLGAVGMEVVRHVVADGALVTATDIDSDRCRFAAHEFGARIIAPTELLATPSDAFVPCATGNLLDEAAAREINTRVIAGAANNLLTDDAVADVLARRGIVLAPDFVANAGGAIHLVGREILGWTADEVSRRVEGIGSTLAKVFDMARSDGTSTEQAARRLAGDRLSRRGAGASG